MHAVKEGNFERFQRIFEDSKEKNPQNKNGWSVLHEAAKRGCHDMVHLMLNNIVICSLELYLFYKNFYKPFSTKVSQF